MNCLLVINTMSGNAAKVNPAEVIRRYAADDLVTVVYLRDPADDYDVNGVEKLIVCGGDGTLGKALNRCQDKEIDLYYLPVGTFNETAKNLAKQGVSTLPNCGKLGDRAFAYVAAAGSFTEIGRNLAAKKKKRFKIFAYFAEVLSVYTVHRIYAEIECEKVKAKGHFTLVMFSNATRCFGFRFNHLHRSDSDELQALLIKAPEKDGIIGRVKMFFPFFRAFFLGFRKEHFGKNLIFASLRSARVRFSEEVPFCLDGEIASFRGDLSVESEPCFPRVRLIRN